MAATEKQWADFILDGRRHGSRRPTATYADYANGFRMLPGETLAGLLEAYEQVGGAHRRAGPDAARPRRCRRRCRRRRGSSRAHAGRPAGCSLHIVAETAQHAGHADIIRETMDGQKSMG